MKLHRPHIPLNICHRVALRQLAALLGCGIKDLHLDHDPALGARQRKGEGKKTVYIPDANDPEHLIYRDKHDHHIKTQIKGDGAQYPDRVLIARERKRTTARERKPKIGPREAALREMREKS